MMNIFSAKSKTKKEKITKLKDAPVLYIPLLQNMGSPALPVVKPGEYVKKYQLIGEISGDSSANIHSPVSGIVKDIKKHPIAGDKTVQTIVIENDFKESEIDLLQDKDVDINKLDISQILDIIKKAGVVGQGGAQYPTHKKYDIQDNKIDTFIINGTECEPYLTNDYALMSESPHILFVAIKIINKVLKAKKIVITIEKQNSELIYSFNYLLNKPEYSDFEVKILTDQYPQGGELQLIKSVTGRELKRGKLPSSAGVIVSNVGTVIAVYNAIVYNKPVIERIITVSGNNLKNAGNYKVKIGTPIEHILKELEITDLAESNHIVVGGSMMGNAITDLQIPITKGSTGVLNFKKKSIAKFNCILCAYCTDVCPMHLMPMKFADYYQKGNYKEMMKYSLSECIECAACQYICPSEVPLMESIKEGKRINNGSNIKAS